MSCHFNYLLAQQVQRKNIVRLGLPTADFFSFPHLSLPLLLRDRNLPSLERSPKGRRAFAPQLCDLFVDGGTEP